MNTTNIEAIRGAVARGWCHPANERKTMDVDLAEAIAQEVLKLSPLGAGVAAQTRVAALKECEALFAPIAAEHFKRDDLSDEFANGLAYGVAIFLAKVKELSNAAPTLPEAAVQPIPTEWREAMQGMVDFCHEAGFDCQRAVALLAGTTLEVPAQERDSTNVLGIAAKQAQPVDMTDEQISDLWGDYGGNWYQFAKAIIRAFATHPQPAEPDIDAMVSRFLGWPLPKDFAPDCGISFDGRKDDEWNKNKTWPTGTNLLSAVQVRALFDYVFGVESRDELRKRINRKMLDAGIDGPDVIGTPTAAADGAVVKAFEDAIAGGLGVVTMHIPAEEFRAVAPLASSADVDDELRTAVIDGLSGLWGCGRVWTAWGVGTMSQDDFYEAWDSDECIAQVMGAINPIIDARIAEARQQGIDSQAARIQHLTHERDLALRATPAAAAPKAVELPPLPEPKIEGSVRHETLGICYSAPVHFTADQMQDYARAAVALAVTQEKK